MSSDQSDVEQYDDWLKDDGEAAALVMRQRLMPVEGKDAVIFPPTYPVNQNRAGYNIDRFDDGSSVCQIDSVGSQANRMEPLFKRKKYKAFVPQIVIEAGDREVHLLDAGHRAADAIVRFSTLGPRLHEAFRTYRDEGNAKPLAKIAPTSIVFGAWDSRATQAKLPRIVRSVIRGYDIEELTRSAQYSTIAGEVLADGEASALTSGGKETKESQLGLAHVPAVQTHGGVLVKGKIQREAILNLSALRALAVPSDEEEETLKLRRYIFGLSLVSFSAPMEPCLREGCELVLDPEHETSWVLVKYDGSRDDFAVSHVEALAFAKAAAEEFDVAEAQESASFDAGLANKLLTMSGENRKTLLRQGPVTKEAIEQLEQRSSKTKGKGKRETKQDG